MRELLKFRFQPSMDLLVVLVSFLALTIFIYITWVIVTPADEITFFILNGLFLMFSVAVPIAYNSLVKKRPLSETGISKKYWKRSLALGLIVSAIFLGPGPSAAVVWPTFMELLPLISFEIALGLFFAIFFQCWAQMRFEKAFGAIPAILIASALFSLHHIGYSGYNEFVPQAVGLFVAGLIPAAIFRITKNILIIWPFFFPISSLLNELGWGFRLPFEATYWFAGILSGMLLFIAIVRWKQKIVHI